MPKINYSPSDLQKIDEILRQIEIEAKEGKVVTALLLAHGYIEALLLELILYSGEPNIEHQRGKWSKQALEGIEKIGFTTLLHINVLLGNIDQTLYNRIATLNKARNDIVHGLIGISPQKLRKIGEKQVKNSRKILEELHSIYMEKIKKRVKRYIGDTD